MAMLDERRLQLLNDPIPFVPAERVRRAGVHVVETVGADCADILAALGITAESVRDGLGWSA